MNLLKWKSFHRSLTFLEHVQKLSPSTKLYSRKDFPRWLMHADFCGRIELTKRFQTVYNLLIWHTSLKKETNKQIVTKSVKVFPPLLKFKFTFYRLNWRLAKQKPKSLLSKQWFKISWFNFKKKSSELQLSKCSEHS